MVPSPAGLAITWLAARRGWPVLARRLAHRFITLGSRGGYAPLMARPAPLVPAALQKELGVVEVKRPYGIWGDLYETTPELRFPWNLDVYDRMRRQDSQTRALLRACTLPILGTKWRLEGKEVRPEVMRFCEAELGLQEDDLGRRRPRDGGISWDKILRHIMLHLPMGFAPLCRWYTVGKPDFPGLPNEVAHLNLSPRMPRTIWGFEEDPNNGHLLGIWQNTITGNFGGIGGFPGGFDQFGPYGNFVMEQGGGPGNNGGPDRVLIDRDHLVMFINEQEGQNWAGESILRPSYKHWIVKDALIRIGALAADRTGMGVPVVTYPEEAAGAKQTALDIASSVRAGEDSGIALPAGWTLTILGVQGQVEDALKWVNYHDQAQSRSMLAMFLDLGYSKGLGSGQTTSSFIDYFLLAEKASIRYVEEVMTEEVLRQLVSINFGKDEAYPTLVADDPHSEAEPTAQALGILAQQGLIHPDIDLRSDVRRRFGLPQEKAAGLAEDGSPDPSMIDNSHLPVGDTGRQASELSGISMAAYHLIRSGFDPTSVMTYLGLKALPIVGPPTAGHGTVHDTGLPGMMPDEGAAPAPAPSPAPAGPPTAPEEAPKPAPSAGPTDSPVTVTKTPSKPRSVHGDVMNASAGRDRRGALLAVGDVVMVALSDGIEPALVFSGGDKDVMVWHGEDDELLTVVPRRKVQLLASAGDGTLTTPEAVKNAIRAGLREKDPDKPVPSITSRLLADKATHADLVFLAGWFERRHRPLAATGHERPMLHTDGKTLTRHGVNVMLRGGPAGESWAKAAAKVKASEPTPPAASPATPPVALAAGGSGVQDLAARLQRVTEQLAALAAAEGA
jgi:hypothetical protein